MVKPVKRKVDRGEHRKVERGVRREVEQKVWVKVWFPLQVHQEVERSAQEQLRDG